MKRKDLESDLEQRPVELLDRLKIVKVSSEGSNPDEKERRQLPQSRTRFEVPTYGYEEPQTVADGKCTLRQALEFISKYQNDPSTHSIPSIAGTYKMKASDVEQVINNFRAFEIFIGRDEKVGFTKEAMRALGANKVVQPLYKSKFRDVDKTYKAINNEKK